MARIVDESFFADDEQIAQPSVSSSRIMQSLKAMPLVGGIASGVEDLSRQDSRKIAGNIASAGQGFTGSFLDEMTAGVKSLPGYLGLLSAGNPEDVSLSDVYRQEKDIANQALDQYRKDYPAEAISSELVGAVLSPASKLRAGGAIGSAALQSGVYGAGMANTLEEVPQEVVESMVLGGSLAGATKVAGSGLKALGGKAGDIATATKNKLYGITASDISQSLRKDVLEEVGKAPVLSAIDRLSAKGVLEAGKPRENLVRITQDKDVLNSLRDSLIKQADSIQPTPVVPDFKKTKSIIKQLDPSEQKQAAKLFSKFYQDFQSSSSGKVSDLENLKKAYQTSGKASFGVAGTDALEAKIKGAMSTDIKAAVDKELKSSVYGQIGDDLKTLRQEAGDRIKIKKVLDKAIARESTQDADSIITSLMRTTGGYGVPIIVGAGVGEGTGAGALTGAAAGLALRSNAGRKALVPILKGTSAAANAAGSTLSSLGPTAARVLGSQLESEQVEEPIKADLPTRKRIVDASFFDEEPPLVAGKTNISFETALETPEGRDLLLDALRQVESGGNPRAISPAGAMGAYQFMPKTAKAYGIDPFDEIASRAAAEQYLLDEYGALGDVRSSLAAYNAGRPNVMKARNKAGANDFNIYADFLPKETQEYSPKVEMAFMKLLEGRS